MAFNVGRMDEMPNATRNKTRVIEQTEEWIQTRSKLAAGLKPYEAFWVTFSPADRERLKLKAPGRTFKDKLKQYLRQAGLKYDVERFRNGDNEVVAVSNPVVARETVHEEVTVSKRMTGAHSKKKAG